MLWMRFERILSPSTEGFWVLLILKDTLIFIPVHNFLIYLRREIRAPSARGLLGYSIQFKKQFRSVL